MNVKIAEFEFNGDKYYLKRPLPSGSGETTLLKINSVIIRERKKKQNLKRITDHYKIKLPNGKKHTRDYAKTVLEIVKSKKISPQTRGLKVISINY